MTTLHIDTKKFKEECEDARYRIECLTDADRATFAHIGHTSHRDLMRVFMEGNFRVTAAAAPSALTEADFRAELSVAARAAYLDGASTAQVNYLASLAVKAGERHPLGYTKLTKAEASRAISEYLKG